MKMAVTIRNQIPHGGGWKYRDPSNGVLITGTTWDQIMSNVRAYRRANGIPIGLGFEDEIEQELCRNHPEECTNYDENYPRKRSLTLSDIIAGSKVMMAFYASGKELVPREEAERRAQICLKCPFNQHFAKTCYGICPELKNVVSAVINHVGTQYDADLHSCTVCGCFIQASVWLPLSTQCHGVDQTQKNQFSNVPNCWKQCE